MNMGAQAGGWLTAWLTPVIAKHFGWTASFLVAAGLCVLGALAWILVDPTRTLEGRLAQVPTARGMPEVPQQTADPKLRETGILSIPG